MPWRGPPSCSRPSWRWPSAWRCSPRFPSRSGPPALRSPCPSLAANWLLADRIELSHAAAVLTLERRGQVWGLAREAGYPIRRDKADALTDALLALRLVRPAQGVPDAIGVGDPGTEAGGTLVRIRAASGAVIGAVILPSVAPPAGQVSYVRRPREETAWVASNAVPDSTEPADWAERTLPPLHAGAEAAADEAVLDQLRAGLPFTAVRAAPQIRAPVDRTVALAVPDGTVTLRVGALDGQAWLRVGGTAPWAARLAPYAFALPPASPLAASP